ncbi:MAG: hypothetical protein SH821_02575 [Phototrophicales bacterium]|nr:hypothetical protein [Phototrophicales bacterium]
MWQRIYHIIFGYEFDFYSDYTLDECESALLANSEREYFRDNIGEIIKQQKNNAQLITVEQANSYLYRFTIEKIVQPKHGFFGVRIFVSGSLRQENIGTLVMGRSKIAQAHGCAV